MKNTIQWFEIPATDFKRAVAFYKGLLNIEMEEMEMYGTEMGLFPSDGSNVSGAVVKGEGYTPSMLGSTVFLNGGDDLQIHLSQVELLGGKVLLPKTQISEEMGYFALFTDTEGNKLGLHSQQ